MSALPAACHAKLVKVLPMLGSDKPGEVVAAASAAPVVIQPSAPRYWRQCAEEVLFEHSGAVTGWEQELLQSILQKRLCAECKAGRYSASNCIEVRRASMVNELREGGA
jgi:hypothetical protein